MKKIHLVFSLVFALVALTACGGGGGNTQGFMQVTQNAFDEGANKEPVDVEAINIVFDYPFCLSHGVTPNPVGGTKKTVYRHTGCSQNMHRTRIIGHRKFCSFSQLIKL